VDEIGGDEIGGDEIGGDEIGGDEIGGDEIWGGETMGIVDILISLPHFSTVHVPITWHPVEDVNRSIYIYLILNKIAVNIRIKIRPIIYDIFESKKFMIYIK
jgi:hypothetical protein